jgi:hypothetical protein
MGTATDNCISALGLVIHHHPTAVDATAASAQWLGYLPLRADKEESIEVLKRLCALVEANDKNLLGNSGENFAAVVRVFADSAMLEHFTGEIAMRVQGLLQQMQQGIDPAMMSAAFGALTPAQQGALQRLSQQSPASPPAAPQ